MKEEDIDSRIERVINDVAQKKALMVRFDYERRMAEQQRMEAEADCCRCAAPACPPPPQPAAGKRSRWLVYLLSGVATVALLLIVGVSFLIRVDQAPQVEFAAPVDNASFGTRLKPQPAVGNTEQLPSESEQAPVNSGSSYDFEPEEVDVVEPNVYDVHYAPADRCYLDLDSDETKGMDSLDYEETWEEIGDLYHQGRYIEALELLNEYKEIPGIHQGDARQLYLLIMEM